jgi:hypothetical protein
MPGNKIRLEYLTVAKTRIQGLIWKLLKATLHQKFIDSEKSTLRSIVAFQWIGSETQAAASKIGYNDNNDVMEQSWPP